MLKKVGIVILAISSASLLSSCSSVSDSKEYQALKSEVVALESSVKNLEVELETANNAPAKLKEIQDERLSLMEQVSKILENPATRKNVITQLGKDACSKYSKTGYDSYARVDFDHVDNTAFWNDVYNHLSPWELILGYFWDEDSDPVGLRTYRTELNATGCADDGANAFYDTCETFDKRVLNKNPDAFIGKCVTGSVSIAQWDTNTGPCSFQGYLGGGYDVRAQFGDTLDPAKHYSVKECDWLSEFVEGNYITFWAFGIGTYSYETTSGGKQTIPAFKIVSVRG